jgi:acyl carrier protein phosphodiesterase
MNFLAHLHLAHLAGSSLPGNLMADFVRGKPDGIYPQALSDGIHLHRRIDVFTDNLPEVKLACSWFRPQTRRVAPVSLDVMWDHFLSRHWARLSPQFSLPDFVDHAREKIEPVLPDSPERFVNLNQYLWSERWLERYSDMGFIASVLNGMANRRPRLASLRDSWQDLDNCYAQLEILFWQFYPVMMEKARNKQL